MLSPGRLLATLAFGLLLLFPAKGQKKSDRDLDGLHGPVKTVRTEIASLDQEGKPDQNGRWLSRMTSYDSSGNKTEDETFYAFGKNSNGKYVYTYDAAGNRIEEAKYLNDSVYKTTYIYNDKRQLIREIKHEGAFHTEYVYDAEGKLIETKGVYGENSVASHFVYIYDSQGQMIKKRRYGGGLDFEQIKTYTPNGQVASEANGSDPKAPLYRRVEYASDDKGNVVERIEYGNKGLEDRSTYSYEFDAFGNWIKRIASREWDSWAKGPVRQTEASYRLITYY